MSLYSTKVSAEILDPRVYIEGVRAEFRLDSDKCYYPDLRIVNLGAQELSAASSNVVSQAGLYSLIRHIHLLDGSKQIASLRFANRYLAFDNLRNENKDNESLTQELARASSMGLHITDQGNCREYKVHAVTNETGDQDQRNAYLDLRKCFGYLEAVSYLDTSMMKDLKVVIEFDKKAQNFLAASNVTFNTKQPQLVCTEIKDEQLKSVLRKQFKGVMYTQIEHDLVKVPAVTQPAAGSTASQSVALRVKGYDGKLVGRIIASKSFSDKTKYNRANVTVGQGEFDSRACIGESVNFRLNGAEVYPGALDSHAKRAMACVEVWGDLNVCPFANVPAQGNNCQNSVVNGKGSFSERAGGTDEDDRIGQSDYIAVDVSDRVSQLQFDFSRTVLNDTANAFEDAALDVNMYAEVQKQIIVKGSGYEINYV